MTPDTWVSTRDHSWGVRYGVGVPSPTSSTTDALGERLFHFFWTPGADGAPRRHAATALFMAMNHFDGTGLRPQGGDRGRRAPRRPRRADGPTSSPSCLRPGQPPAPRRRVHCTMPDGTTRTLQVEVGLRHRLPPRHRALLRVRRPPPRRMARRPPRRRRAHRRLLGAGRPLGASTRSATPSCASPIRSVAATGYGNCQPMVTGGHAGARPRRCRFVRLSARPRVRECGLHVVDGERVAIVDDTRRVAAGEPLGALFGRAVGPRLGVDVHAGLRLDAVVADRGGGL